MDVQPISIRRTEAEDFRAICEIHAQPKAIWGTLQVPFPSVEDWRKRLAEMPEHLFGLVACAGDTVVGNLGLFVLSRTPRRRHTAEVGMAIHDEWQGRGVGTSLMDAAIDLADRWLNVDRLELTVYVDNEPAIALYRKFGFVTEGRFRRYAFRDGEFVDAFAMARLR